MKVLMKSALAGLLFAGMTMTASAQAVGGNASQKLGEKIATEIMQEMMTEAQNSGKQPSPEDFSKKLIEKMRANLDEMKKGSTEDCVEVYGKDKSSNCQCVTDKTDFESIFALMEKQMANPQAEPKEEIKALEQKTEENYKACDLDIAVMKKASEEAMKKMAPVKG